MPKVKQELLEQRGATIFDHKDVMAATSKRWAALSDADKARWVDSAKQVTALCEQAA